MCLKLTEILLWQGCSWEEKQWGQFHRTSPQSAWKKVLTCPASCDMSTVTPEKVSNKYCRSRWRILNGSVKCALGISCSMSWARLLEQNSGIVTTVYGKLKTLSITCIIHIVNCITLYHSAITCITHIIDCITLYVLCDEIIKILSITCIIHYVCAMQ